MVKINGKDVEWKEGATAEQYLLENGYQIERIALERNGKILPQSPNMGVPYLRRAT